MRTPNANRRVFPWLALALTLWSAFAVWFCYSHGWLMYYGDAEAHLDIARRVVDSQTPGYDQIGTVWLPLPHALMLPFVRYDGLWRTGLAGSIPSAACFIAAGLFLFAAARRIFGAMAPALAAVALFALNPNMLYLQSTAMTESVFAAALAALLYFSVRFRDTQGLGAVCGAGIAACAGTLTRYEGWFLLPFAAAYFFFTAKRRRTATALVFCAIAGAGPLYWLFHNWWLSGDVLEFYRGPYSARAIQGRKLYPGQNNWGLAWLYYGTAVRLCANPWLAVLAMAGAVAALARRIFWPLALLALPGIFYVWSLHSSATPIYVPELWPRTYYNSRYGLAALPLLALAAAALVAAIPPRRRGLAAVLVVAAGAGWWAAHPQPVSWITWAESRTNTAAWRASTLEAADYLVPRYRPGTGIVTSFGDLTAIWRTMGVPLRDTFTGDSGLLYDAALARPELHLRQEWAVTTDGSPLEAALRRAARFGMRYNLELAIERKNAPAIRIYKR
jgi:hypothetical protein